MNTQMAKVFGWTQFLMTAVPTAFAHGVPTNAMGWLAILGSLATAVGIHAAAATDGVK